MSFLCSENLYKTPRSQTVAVILKQLLEPKAGGVRAGTTITSGPTKDLLPQLQKLPLQILEKGTDREKRRKPLEVLLLLQETEKWRLCKPAVDIQREAEGETGHSESKEETSQNCFVSHLQNMGPHQWGGFFRSDSAVLVADLQGKKELMRPWHLDLSHTNHICISYAHV